MAKSFTEVDLKNLKNIKTALLQGRFDLTGVEALELSKMIVWVNELLQSESAALAQKAVQENPRDQPSEGSSIEPKVMKKVKKI